MFKYRELSTTLFVVRSDNKIRRRKMTKIEKRCFPRIKNGKLYTKRIGRKFLVADDSLFDIKSNCTVPMTALEGYNCGPMMAYEAKNLNAELEKFGLVAKDEKREYRVVDARGSDGSVELSHHESYYTWIIRRIA